MLLRHLLFAFFLALASATAGAAGATEAQPAAADPVLEARLNHLTEQLRCLVCQNQSIAESHADLAIDLKNEIREMMQKGQTDQQIVDFMVARYGDFVLYKPPVRESTWLLWFGPFLLFAVALAALVVLLRRRRPQQEALDEAARARARALLRETDGNGSQP